MELHLKFEEGTTAETMRAVHLDAFKAGATSIRVLHRFKGDTSDLLYLLEGPDEAEGALTDLVYRDDIEYVSPPPTTVLQQNIISMVFLGIGFWLHRTQSWALRSIRRFPKKRRL